MYKRSEFVLKMSHGIGDFIKSFSTKSFVTSSICGGYGLLRIMTWRPSLVIYLYNAMIKLAMSFNSKKGLVCQIKDIIPKWFHVFI